MKANFRIPAVWFALTPRSPKLSELLTTIAKNCPIDESLRPAYEKAADAIESEYYRGAALSAERKSATSR